MILCLDLGDQITKQLALKISVASGPAVKFMKGGGNVFSQVDVGLTFQSDDLPNLHMRVLQGW